MLWYSRHMLQYHVGLFFGAATVTGEDHEGLPPCFVTYFQVLFLASLHLG